MFYDCGCDEYNRLTRRSFLGTAGAFGAGAFLGLLDPRLLWAEPAGDARAKSTILLWMAGGQSHLDTWDPKPGTETGGPTQAIDTAVAGIRISEHLPMVAGQFDDVALVRSLTGTEGNHDRATYQLHTGYPPIGSFEHATLGSVFAKQLTVGDPDLPAYITINGRRWPAGHLGSKYAAFHIGSATEPAQNLTFHRSVDAKRFEARLKLLRRLDAKFADAHRKEEVIQAYADHYNAAHRMMKSPKAAAFDLTRERPEVRQAYGMSQFGQGCLLARRLVQQGVRFVEVSLGGWDTHQENFTRTADACKTLDQALATLLEDLRHRELLPHTLVVLCSEFGRTPKINANQGRDHWPRVWSAVLAGGGVAGGRVVGASDAQGREVADRPVQIAELQATICHLMGVDHHRKLDAPDGRPIRIVPDRAAQRIGELLA
ncbi:MAG: DUF1501 domain-containing protein [Phycisphaerae bacterium]